MKNVTLHVYMYANPWSNSDESVICQLQGLQTGRAMASRTGLQSSGPSPSPCPPAAEGQTPSPGSSGSLRGLGQLFRAPWDFLQQLPAALTSPTAQQEQDVFESSVDGDVLLQQLHGGSGGGGGGAEGDSSHRHGSDVDGELFEKSRHDSASHSGPERHGSAADDDGSRKHSPAAADGTKRHGSKVDGDGSQKHSHAAADGTKRHGSDVDGDGSQKHSPAAADGTNRHGSEVDGEAPAEKDYAAGADEVFGPAGPDEGRRKAVGVDPNDSNRPQEPATGSRNAQLSDDYDEDYVKLLKRSMSEKEGRELHQVRQLLRWHYRHLPDAERDDTVFRLMLFAPGLPDVRPSTLQRLLHTSSDPLSPVLSPGPARQGQDPSAAGSQHESGVSSLDSGDEEAMEAWVQTAVTRSVEFRTEYKARRQGQEAEARSLSQRVLQLAMRDGKETRGTREKKAAEHDEIVPTSGAAAAGNHPAAVGVSC